MIYLYLYLLNIKGTNMKINNYKSDFFEEIDNELKAYILGYIVADGSIVIEPRKDRPSTIKRVQFQCSINDLEVIELIRDSIAPNNKISFIKSKIINRTDAVRLRLANVKIVNDLISLYDIKPRKTYDTLFKMPIIEEKLKRHFIRGFIDGDGSIGKRHFSMVINSKFFLEDILECFLKNIPDLKYYIYKENRKYTDYYSLHFSVNKKSRLDLYNYLYKDCNYKLSRKFNKALNAVLNSKSKDLLSA